MSIQSYIFLHALPDFSRFQFRTGQSGALLIQMHFVPLRSGIYDLSIEQRQWTDTFYPYLFTEEDAKGLISTVVQVIELYTEQYPCRVIRLKGNTLLQTVLFRVILRRHHDLLSPLFSIDKNGGKRFFPFRRNAGDSVFLLKRRPDTVLPSQLIRASVRARSQLFGNWVHVELHKEIGVGVGA
ncbi:DUF6934 family protein [Puia sp.]|jgi:hypothetical protein|uniref:DUF6934 family protein n=1 Tax=Puia sp. TaxID=2045100 RepID=UPI002F42F60B